MSDDSRVGGACNTVAMYKYFKIPEEVKRGLHYCTVYARGAKKERKKEKNMEAAFTFCLLAGRDARKKMETEKEEKIRPNKRK